VTLVRHLATQANHRKDEPGHCPALRPGIETTASLGIRPIRLCKGGVS
jgi:hypothetical protein